MPPSSPDRATANPYGQALSRSSRRAAAGAILGIAALMIASCAPPSASPPGRPNLLVILVDDLGFADVGWRAAGDPRVRTPSMDRLAREGLRFERYATAPMCSPARAGLLTGRNPLRMGLYRNIRQNDTIGMPLAERTFAEDFQDAGYATSLVGKWHLGHAAAAQRPLARGFAGHYGFLGGWIDYLTHRREERHDWERDGVALEEEGYVTTLLADEAVRTLRERDRERPFFLWLALSAPHAPVHVPPGRSLDELGGGDDLRRAYLLMVAELDRAIGRVMSALREEGLDERTLVLLVSDNGGDISYGASNAPLRGGKFEVWEGGIRAPAVLRWPGTLPPGEWPGFTTFLDLAPTLAAACGVPLERAAELDGRDLWPVLLQDAPAEPLALAVGSERREELRLAVTDGAQKLAVTVAKPSGAEQRVQYDLLADPLEAHDVLGRRPRPWFQERPRTALETWLGMPRLPLTSQ